MRRGRKASLAMGVIFSFMGSALVLPTAASARTIDEDIDPHSVCANVVLPTPSHVRQASSQMALLSKADSATAKKLKQDYGKKRKAITASYKAKISKAVAAKAKAVKAAPAKKRKQIEREWDRRIANLQSAQKAALLKAKQEYQKALNGGAPSKKPKDSDIGGDLVQADQDFNRAVLKEQQDFDATTSTAWEDYLKAETRVANETAANIVLIKLENNSKDWSELIAKEVERCKKSMDSAFSKYRGELQAAFDWFEKRVRLAGDAYKKVTGSAPEDTDNIIEAQRERTGL